MTWVPYTWGVISQSKNSDIALKLVLGFVYTKFCYIYSDFCNIFEIFCFVTFFLKQSFFGFLGAKNSKFWKSEIDILKTM